MKTKCPQYGLLVLIISTTLNYIGCSDKKTGDRADDDTSIAGTDTNEDSHSSDTFTDQSNTDNQPDSLSDTQSAEDTDTESIAVSDTATNSETRDSDIDTSSDETDTNVMDFDTDIWDSELDTEQEAFEGKKFRGVHVLDRDYLMVHFVDGEVLFTENTEGSCAYSNCNEAADNTVVPYGLPLDTTLATAASTWRITSDDDAAYNDTGLNPDECYRKSKINGMAQLDWNMSQNDFNYEITNEHWIYLALPAPLNQDSTYTLHIAAETNTDVTEYTFTYDIFQSRSEALHVNLAGYHPQSAINAADLYHWMGDGGSRDYSAFEGNAVYLFNVDTQVSQQVGQVSFWKQDNTEMLFHNFIRSDVWNVDFTGTYEPGVYRLAVEGVGASEDFVIAESAVFEPFKVSLLGYFYMRIGQDNMDMTPVPRRPLWTPGQDPIDCKVLVTSMDPYHPDWAGGGDRWDSPSFFSDYVLAGSPENPNAKGGHSDALDWDRHLGHVANIYDLLISYLLTGGVIGSDSLGINESGNGIPDLIDEARNEVDFWLSLRYDGGYSHGLSNPDGSTHILYQANNTALAAWANAANAAMLAAALQVAGRNGLSSQYIAAAEEAWTYASGLSDQMLDIGQDQGSGIFTGRDFKMTAASWLYNLTGDTDYEEVIAAESIVTDETSEFVTEERNQLYAMAAYLHTEQLVHYPTLQDNMRASVIYQARQKEANFTNTRPSRRATDNNTGWFHTVQQVHRTILAHSVATDTADLELFERALVLEADWGLGRNPANMIQMTTATTRLATHRSVENAYTSGFSDGTPGVHPGHTPYLNVEDWGGSMIMGRPSWMTDQLYPSANQWPAGEFYFNTRYVYAHSEFTPQQTMRGKMALYGYLLGMAR